jgi:hypothetical protein
VVAFASATTGYTKLLRRTPWQQAGIDARLVTITGVTGGAMSEVPRRLGQASQPSGTTSPPAIHPAPQWNSSADDQQVPTARSMLRKLTTSHDRATRPAPHHDGQARSADVLTCRDPRFGLSQISWRTCRTSPAGGHAIEPPIGLRPLVGPDPVPPF